MDKDKFWQMADESREKAGNDDALFPELLQDRLSGQDEAMRALPEKYNPSKDIAGQWPEWNLSDIVFFRNADWKESTGFRKQAEKDVCLLLEKAGNHAAIAARLVEQVVPYVPGHRSHMKALVTDLEAVETNLRMEMGREPVRRKEGQEPETPESGASEEEDGPTEEEEEAQIWEPGMELQGEGEGECSVWIWPWTVSWTSSAIGYMAS